MKQFISPTYGTIEFDDVISYIVEFIAEDINYDYVIAIGSDSQTSFDHTLYTSVVTIHRIGSHGRFFYYKEKDKVYPLKQRLINETYRSLQLALDLNNKLPLIENVNVKLEVHCDVSYNGESSKAIKEVVGMVKGCGIENVLLKPDSWAANSVANKYTK